MVMILSLEDYRLVAVDGPAMLVSGADENNASLTGTNSATVLFDPSDFGARNRYKHSSKQCSSSGSSVFPVTVYLLG